MPVKFLTLIRKVISTVFFHRDKVLAFQKSWTVLLIKRYQLHISFRFIILEIILFMILEKCSFILFYIKDI